MQQNSPSFIVPYSHRSVQATSCNQWFSYTHIHTSYDSMMEGLWQQLKRSNVTLFRKKTLVLLLSGCESGETFCIEPNTKCSARPKQMLWHLTLSWNLLLLLLWNLNMKSCSLTVVNSLLIICLTTYIRVFLFHVDSDVSTTYCWYSSGDDVNWRSTFITNLSEFLGHIFFSCPNDLNFCMWPSTS